MKFLRSLIPDSWYPGMVLFVFSNFLMLILTLPPLSLSGLVIHFIFCIFVGTLKPKDKKTKKE